METTDPEPVRRVLQRYVDATYRADVQSLRTLLHPAALVAGCLGENLVVGDPEPFLSDLANHVSMAETETPYRGGHRVGSTSVQ